MEVAIKVFPETQVAQSDKDDTEDIVVESTQIDVVGQLWTFGWLEV